jgi:PAS domain S-box-containing protein
MNSMAPRSEAGSGFRAPVVIAGTVAVVIFAFTWIAIRQSRQDSFELLRRQGIAFTEVLAQASNNAIAAESFYDYLVQKRYGDLVISLIERNLNVITEPELTRFIQAHDLYSIHIYDSAQNLVVAASNRGVVPTLPDYVRSEVAQLIANPEVGFVLLSDQASGQVDVTHYYLEITGKMDRVIVISSDALYYDEAIHQTGIGYLAQRMAQEQGIEYIIYQSTEGIIFSSSRISRLLSIDSDPFLKAALTSDTIVTRHYEFQGKSVLELVRPFSTERFEFGLFRVGLSLERYHAVLRGLVIQLVILSVILVLLLTVFILYYNSRQQRRELRREYTRMKTVTDEIFEQMQTGVAAIDAAGVIRLANHAFEEVFAISGPVGRAWSEVMPDDRLNLSSFAASPERSDEIEISLQAGGREKTLLVARSKLSEEGTAQPSMVIVVSDITRLKEYEALTARREWLSELGNLAASVAHEIRNPLNAISIAAQRLSSEFQPKDNEAEYRSFTEKIRTETRRLNDIITRFLSLSRAERKNQTLIRLDEVLNGIVDLLRLEAQRINIDLQLQTSEELFVRVDPDKLKQVVQNLFNNAKEAMDGRNGTIAVEAVRKDDSIILSVSDDGPGIPPELRDRVFTPYFTTKDAGTGLGLAAVHQIITELGGETAVTNSPLGGARIEMTLPVAPSGS